MNATHKCPHCNTNALTYITATSGHCTNRQCNGYMITLPMVEFLALTPAQLASYQCGRTSVQALDVEQELFDLRMAQLERDIAARQAARVAGERVYG